MKLTPKQELFINEYCIDRNATRAYKDVYKSANDNTAAKEGCKILKNPKVAQEIENRIAKRAKDNGITAEFVLNGIKAIATKGEKENDKLKAFELLGKHLKLFTEKQEIEHSGETTVNSKIDLTGFTTEQLKEMLK